MLAANKQYWSSSRINLETSITTKVKRIKYI